MPRVELRPYEDADLPLTVALEADPVVKRDLGGVLDAEEAERIHRERLERMHKGELFYTVRVGEDPEPVGIVAVFRTPFEGEDVHEIGIMVLPGRTGRGGRGVGMEALRQLTERARAELGSTRLHGFTSVDNGVINLIGARLGWTNIGQTDLDYEGRPMRCNHWILDITA
jgi:RimJ/RimL family protein N-acetyltransferase